ncbi:Smr/MutS family protein [uncultured Lentibacter sp.]|jgi:DNA-nicking Smr family endonuclease|uniref:Smr/MutS family protein n=1 Tax=uncultured Lentibacter sp. TaxID=1659309 RepID=UPI002624FCF1|nr:Smr/MutS family protein [uncultured Lentibacter sp.]
MSRRKLHKDELELWGKVAETAVPMHPKRRKPQEALRNAMPVVKRAREPIAPFEMSTSAKEYRPAIDVLPDIRERVAKAPVQMDKKAHGRLKQGKLKPEAKIDLHGMTLDQAHPRLTAFIMKAYQTQKRLVLVVTGKGKLRDDGGPIPVRFGVLRHQVPQWLSTPPLAQLVLQVTEAHLRHGGGGAYYVYLRRQR